MAGRAAAMTALLLLLPAGLVAGRHVQAAPKHVALVLIDDLGYGDVGYAGAEYPTPIIDGLALDGVRLNQSYVMQVCSPTRTSLLTGRYSYNIGTDGNVLNGNDARCAPVGMDSIADALKAGGVATAIVGKWDNGFSSWACTPGCRGFDYFLGYYGASEDYYLHGGQKTLDFHEDFNQAPQYRGEYSTQLFTRKALEWLQQTVPKKSTFLFMSYQAVHGPLEAPEGYLAACKHITETNRKTYCAMMQALDEGVGNLTAGYKDLGVWSDTLLVFLSDNGGQPDEGGYNVPLRGKKGTVWEGGVRSQSFVRWDGLAQGRRGTVYGGLVHVSDWLPTITSALLGRPAAPQTGQPPLDGVDTWAAVRDGGASPRSEMLLSLRDATKCGQNDKTCAYPGQLAFRSGRYKLIYGHPPMRGKSGDECTWDNSSAPVRVISCGNGWMRPFDQGPSRAPPTLPPAPGQPSGRSVYSFGGVFLFDIEADPTEENDLSAQLPDMVQELTAKLDAFKAKHISQDVEKGTPSNEEPCGSGLQCLVPWIQPASGAARCAAPSPGPSPAPGPSPPGDCLSAEQRLCPATQYPDPTTCRDCCRTNKAELVAAGCGPGRDFNAYCNVTLSPPLIGGNRL